MDNEKEKIPSNIHTVESEGREKLCTRVMNETTLRVYCLQKSNTETFTQDFYTPNVLLTGQEETEEAKDYKEKTKSQG